MTRRRCLRNETPAINGRGRMTHAWGPPLGGPIRLKPDPTKLGPYRGKAHAVSVVPAGTSTCWRPSSMYVIGDVPCMVAPIW